MATITLSGATAGGGAGDVTYDLFVDNIEVTGNYTISSGDTITFSVGAATQQSEVNPVVVTGNFSFTNAGIWILSGTSDILEIVFESNASPKEGDSWQGIRMNAVGVGTSVTNLRIKHAAAGLRVTGTYTTDNATLTRIIAEDCRSAFEFQQGVASSFGEFEAINCNQNVATIGVCSFASAFDATIDKIHTTDCRSHGGAVSFNSTGTFTITDLITDNVSSGSGSFGHLFRRGGTPTVRITNWWAWNNNGQDGNGMEDWTSGDILISNGIWRGGGPFMRFCLNTTCEVNGMDIYGLTYQSFDAGSGGNLDNCYVAGFSLDDANQVSLDSVESTVGGVQDGVAEVAGGVYNTMDSVLNARATRNFPITVGAVTVTSVTDNGATFSFTSNVVGRSYLVFSFTAVTVNESSDLTGYAGQSQIEYEEVVDHSQDGKTQTETGVRTIVVSNLLNDGQPYFVRAVTETPWGEIAFSDETTFTTTASAGVSTTVGNNPIVITTPGNGVITTNKLRIIALKWNAETSGKNIRVEDQNNNTFWSATSTAQNLEPTLILPNPVNIDGLIVPVMSDGSLFIYMR